MSNLINTRTAVTGQSAGSVAGLNSPVGEELTVDRITVQYGDYVAVEDISLGVEPGHTTAVIGPSGCGKSTTLKAVAGLSTVTRGSILLGGRDITEMAPSKRNIGMVPQSYACFPHMTVASNIAYGLKARRVDAAGQKKTVDHILELTQLTQFADRKPDQLSGGQRQRVALGRALAIEPSVLLLDEPLAALDPQLRGDLRRQLAAMLADAGCGTLIVTHDQHEALSLADRIAILQDGRMVQYGTPEELWSRPANAFVADFLTNSTLLDAKTALGHAYLLGDHWRIPLENLEQVQDLERKGTQVLIRPTSLAVTQDRRADSVEVVVDSVEYAGGRLQAVVVAPTDVKMLLTTDTEILAPGQQINVVVRPGVTIIGEV